MEESIKYWKSVKSFFFRGEHLLSAQDETLDSKLRPSKNDGRTLQFYFDDRTFIASNIGETDVIIKYDVRPSAGKYRFYDGRYIPHVDGDITIEGYYPNYRIAGLFIPVYIGPHLYFYPQPQDDILHLAKTGKLKAPTTPIKRQCLTCEREIPSHLGPRAKYCSVECGLVTRDMLRRQKAANYEARRFTLPKITPIRKCKKCGGDMPKELNGRFKYCSVECGLMTRDMSPQPKNYPCDYCGNLFARKGPQRFCSESCKLKDKLQCLES